ncbi:hypothetical protein HPB48_002587 [Haemaphysalis longicornis]|uniref:CRAL/TRIO N-terminal domain-containing protein n=1 Tax=Haemaphysalis longicornis TaxID=44386 RepID=A0A9J6G1Y6_HAELO|nr:hypothetical protein HPB48_002587 [Haemaphysalis longicornis]
MFLLSAKYIVELFPQNISFSYDFSVEKTKKSTETIKNLISAFLCNREASAFVGIQSAAPPRVLSPQPAVNEMYTKKSPQDEFDTSEGALPFSLQQIGELELGETPRRRKESLALLLQLLSEDQDLNPRKDMHFLLRFLRVRKYNVEATFRSVQKYYRIRHASGPVFHDFLPSKVTPAARKLMMILPNKDVHGRPIFLYKFGSWVPEQSSYVEGHRAIMLCLEHLAKDPVTQTLGLTILFDYEGITVDKVLRLEHWTDQTADGVLAVQLRLHGVKFDNLHKEISPDVLPKEYGGQAPPLDFDGFWKGLESHDDDYRKDSSYGYTRRHDMDFATEAEIEDELSFL